MLHDSKFQFQTDINQFNKKKYEKTLISLLTDKHFSNHVNYFNIKNYLTKIFCAKKI